MAITRVGAGAIISANNANLSDVPLPGGLADGDYLVMSAFINNAAAFQNGVTNPGGWTILGGLQHFLLFGRTYRAADFPGGVGPDVAVTGGAAGNAVAARIYAYRGTSGAQLVPVATQTNGAATTVAYPARTVPRNGALVLLAGARAAQHTGVTAEPSFTEDFDSFGAAGTGWSLFLQSWIQTTATAITADSVATSGGVSTASYAIVAVLEETPVITAVEQDVYPPRVLVTVTGVQTGDDVQLYREVGGARTLMRSGTEDSATDPAFVRVDAELPFGVQVTYVAVVRGMEVSTAAHTYVLPGGKVVLSDAIGGQAAEVVILAWPERRWDREQSRFKVGGRNVVVSGDLGQWEGRIELFLETTPGVQALLALMEDATGGVVQVRQPGGYDGVDSYVSASVVAERRFSQDGSDQRRVVVLDAIEVEAWADVLESPGFTLQDLADAYSGATLDDVDDDYATLLALAQGDFS